MKKEKEMKFINKIDSEKKVCVYIFWNERTLTLTDNDCQNDKSDYAHDNHHLFKRRKREKKHLLNI